MSFLAFILFFWKILQTLYLDIFLQNTGYLHLKVSLLQDSFVREIWNRVGKQAYLETIHPLVLSNLYISPDKNSAASASVLLIGSSEEIGVPITIHQVILVLQQPSVVCFPMSTYMHPHIGAIIIVLLTLYYWIRLSCLLFTALGKDCV